MPGQTSWTTFVKKWAAEHGVSYPCASTTPKCRADYEAWKAKNGMPATRPRKAPGEPKRKYVRKDPNAPVVPKRKYVRKPKPPAGDTTLAMRNPTLAAKIRVRASTKADKTWVDDWAKSIGASFEAKPKRKYVRKPKPPAGDTTLAMRNPTLARKLALNASLGKLD